jgi:hypothetical protein
MDGTTDTSKTNNFGNLCCAPDRATAPVPTNVVWHIIGSVRFPIQNFPHLHTQLWDLAIVMSICTHASATSIQSYGKHILKVWNILAGLSHNGTPPGHKAMIMATYH